MKKDDAKKAKAEGSRMRATLPGARAAYYDDQLKRIIVNLASGLDISFAPRSVQGLEKAKAGAMGTIEISPSGFGLHFPLLDADVYLPALLEGFLGSRNWMAAQLGRQGGKVRSTVKAKAARSNGKLGGRPRKAA